MEVNLDAARAARAEKQKEQTTVLFGGEEFTLPPELPLSVARMMSGDVIAGMEALLGDQWPRFEALHPSFQDVTELFEAIGPVYGFANTGESPASSPSSKGTSGRSRPTSNAATA